MRSLALFFILLAVSARAETVAVRSGEHRDFTRIVLNLSEYSSWAFTQEQSGYSLKLIRKGIDFDLKSVFQLIPRTRLADVSLDQGAQTLNFRVNEGVTASASEDDPGVIVIDFRDQDTSLKPIERNEPIVLPAMDQSGQFNFFWRGVPEAPVLPKGSPPKTAQFSGDEAPPPLGLINERIAKAEEQMLEQLSRAASQGLVSIDVVPQDVPSSAAAVADEAHSAPTHMPDVGKVTDSIGASAETAVDRDSIAPFEKQNYSSNGVNCYPDSFFNLSYDDKEVSVFSKIVETRLSIVGEFDRAIEDEVEELARLYLIAGFGAEARTTLRSFSQDQSTPSERIESLHYIADIVDSEAEIQDGKIKNMLDCDGDVALWALLGAETATGDVPVNVRAVVRAYSALPENLKDLVYGRAAENLIALGYPDAVQNLKNSKNRSGVVEGEVDFSDAQLNLSHGDKEKAREDLTAISAEPSINAGEATLLLIEDAISAGDVPLEEQVLNLESMLLPLIPSPDGKRALTAYIVAAARTGRFSDAFSAYDRWGEDVSLTDGASKIFDELVRQSDGYDFVNNYFSRADAFHASALSEDAIVLGSQKLTGLGFFDEALKLLDKSNGKTAGVVLSRAQSYIGKKMPEEALKRLEGQDGDLADKLRAEALALLGNDLEAAALYRAQADAKKAADLSWRAGDWAVLSQGEDPQAQALRDVLEPIESDMNAPASLSGAEEKIKASQKFREGIQTVFGQ